MKRCVSCKRPAWQGKFCSSCGAALRDDTSLTHRTRRFAIIAAAIIILGIISGWGLAAAGLFRATTNLDLTIIPSISNCTGTYTYKVVLTDAAGKGLAGQPVLLSLDSKHIEMLRTDQNGRLESLQEIPDNWCGASHTFTASTIGSFKLGPATNSTVIAARMPSTIALLLPVRVVANQDVQIGVIVRDARTGEPLRGKMIRVWNARDAIYASTGEQGIATVTYRSQVAGTETLSATLLPDDNYNVSIVSASLTVEAATTEEIVALARTSIVAVTHDNTIGSGIIIRADDGTAILTNKHVVEGASSISAITIIFSNGTKVIPTAVHVAPHDIDLAVIYLPVAIGNPASVPLDSEYAQGAPVLAIGAPLGITGSVSQGILSNRIDTHTSEDYSYAVLQTDAAINPGNSGGGLFARDSGNLLGINTEKIKNAEGLGFAIDSREFLRLPPDSQWATLS